MKTILLVLCLALSAAPLSAQDRGSPLPPPPPKATYSLEDRASIEDVEAILRGSGVAFDVKRMVQQGIDSGQDGTQTSRNIVALDDAAFERILAGVLAPHVDAGMARRVVGFHASDAGKALLADFRRNPDVGDNSQLPPQYVDEVLAYLGGEDAAYLRGLTMDEEIWVEFMRRVDQAAAGS